MVVVVVVVVVTRASAPYKQTRPRLLASTASVARNVCLESAYFGHQQTRPSYLHARFFFLLEFGPNPASLEKDACVSRSGSWQSSRWYFVGPHIHSHNKGARLFSPAHRWGLTDVGDCASRCKSSKLVNYQGWGSTVVLFLTIVPKRNSNRIRGLVLGKVGQTLIDYCIVFLFATSNPFQKDCKRSFSPYPMYKPTTSALVQSGGRISRVIPTYQDKPHVYMCVCVECLVVSLLSSYRG